MDHLDLAKDLLARARAGSVMIATAESCTGGLVGGAITDIPGASDVFEGGFITYSNHAKMALLGVQDGTLSAYGAVSEQVAAQMADGALNRTGADIAVSVTGIAGPGGSEHKPEGRVCFGLAQAGQETRTQTVEFGAIGRANVRAQTVNHALGLLIDALS